MLLDFFFSFFWGGVELVSKFLYYLNDFADVGKNSARL